LGVFRWLFPSTKKGAPATHHVCTMLHRSSRLDTPRPRPRPGPDRRGKRVRACGSPGSIQLHKWCTFSIPLKSNKSLLKYLYGVIHFYSP
jgi:hypothetical protein